MFDHYSVLNEETVYNCINDKNGIYIDGTLGGAGHTVSLLKNLLPKAKVISFDQDILAIKATENIKDKRLTVIHDNFVTLKEHMIDLNIDGINGLILDLGFSSEQVDQAQRGFSYMQDGPLDMRMDERQDLTAHKIVNEYDMTQLCEIFKKYGEEKFYVRIANGIIKRRETKEIKSTLELVEIIESSIGKKELSKIKGHSSKKIFQALRIEVNEELNVLNKIIEDAYELLKPGGKIAIITFHSLEDKLVKHKFLNYSKVSEELENLPVIPPEYLPKARVVNKKPILPSKDEIEENSRSKSAKLRILEKL